MNNANSLFIIFQYLNANIFEKSFFKKENVFNFIRNETIGVELRKKKATNEKEIHNKHPNQSFNEDKNNKLTRPVSSNAHG